MSFSDFIQILEWRAKHQPSRLAYQFIEGDLCSTLTYSELDRKARVVASNLLNRKASGHPVLIIYRSGFDFIPALFGCFYAGAIAVPAYPPRSRSTIDRLKWIAINAAPRLTLTTEQLKSSIESVISTEIVTTDGPTSETSHELVSVQAQPIAMIQYTSGSTADPKGVVLNHQNLISNSEVIADAFSYGPESHCVSWLPLYHDMGLIGGVLQPMFGGFPCTMMLPAAFLQRPFEWLKTISKYRATISGAPNFAYDLCVKKITVEQKSRLDLSSWSVAFNGSERVEAETLKRFSAAFESCGFKPEAFHPCYGLAEATLMVTGRRSKRSTISCRAPKSPKNIEHVADEKVSCGVIPDHHQVVIADPESLTNITPGMVGEVWVKAPSVANGYWNQPAQTEEVFYAYLANGDGPFLRTGDLGFISDGELFITGRIKDLVIVRGLKYYPVDIELVATQSHAALEPNSVAACSMTVDTEERLLIVAELRRKHYSAATEIIDSIMKEVSEKRGIRPHVIGLIKAGTLPKTTSGKIRRNECSRQFLEGLLEVIAEWREPSLGEQQHALREATSLSEEHDLTAWLIEYLSTQAGVVKDRVEIESPIVSYGIDSLGAAQLVQSIEATFNRQIPVEQILQGASILDVTRSAILAQEFENDVAAREGAKQEDECDATLGQEALWFLEKLAPGNPAYHIARAFRVRGAFNLTLLEVALRRLCERQPGLRTVFGVKGDRVIQRRLHLEDTPLDILVANEDSLDERSLREILISEAYRPFDLERGPLLRIRVFVRSESEYTVLFSVHHIIADLWSLALFYQELDRMLGSPEFGSEYASAVVPDLFDYARRQRNLLSSGNGSALKDYWLQELEGTTTTLELPADHNRGAVQDFRGNSFTFDLGERVSKRVYEVASLKATTPFVVLLAAFEVLIHRYTGREDFIIGSPFACRNSAEWAETIGYFANPVALRARLNGGMSFEELLNAVRKTVTNALAHQQYPFALLVKDIDPAREPNRPPVFQVSFSFQSLPSGNNFLGGLALGKEGTQARLGNLPVEVIELGEHGSQFDLSLTMTRIEEGLSGCWQFSTSLFEPATVARLNSHFLRLLDALLTHMSSPVGRVPLLDSAERNQVLKNWSSTARQPLPQTSVVEMFSEHARSRAGAIAARSGDTSVTYGELDELSNQLARELIERGVTLETRVGVSFKPSVEMVVALLGILKAGAAYVPLEGTATEREKWIVEDAGVTLILSDSSRQQAWTSLAVQTLSLDGDWQQISRHSRQQFLNRIFPQNSAYVIYTSGSTGRPKGVAVTHEGLVNYLWWCRQTYELSGNAVVHSPLSFDLTVTSLWGPLVSGGSVMLVEPGIEPLADALRNQDQFRLLKITPAHLQGLNAMVKADEIAAQRRVIVIGGEALTGSMVQWLMDRDQIRLINEYGPTEAVVGCIVHELMPGEEHHDRIVIGRPIGNVEAYVLDGDMEPVPVGVIGELYLGGKSLARGYEGRGDLTAAAFVPHGFSEERGARLYRTGDLVRYREGGELEFVGRRDEQVKIRGYRIELGEIEAVLQQHEQVVAAVVVSRVEERRGEQELVAYVVGEGERGIEKRELREYLRQRLPEYMVPARLEVLGELPLTSNGKVDRQALPAPEAEELSEQYEAPRSLEQEIMAGIWADVLGVEQVGIGEDFFALGGHSLLATQVMTRMSEALGVRVPLRSLFEQPTIAGLSAELKRAGAGVAPPRMERVSRAGELPLSYAQQRLWFLEQLAPESAAYNVPLGVRLRGALDKEALRRSLNEIVKRHEVLRTSFPEVGGKPVQRIAAWEEIVVEEQDLSEEEDGEYKARKELAAEARRPFALAQGPLLRARLLQVGEEDHVLLVTMHHIISDGWSMGVLVRELAAFYEAYTTGAEAELSELPIQYADYAVWQRQWLEQGVKEEQLRYWRAELAGVETLNLPTDRVRPAIESFRGGQVEVVWEEELVERLRKLSREQGVTLFMVLLAGLEVLLACYSGQPEVVVGTAIANRHQRQIEDLIGFFVNTVVLRGEVRGGMSMVELIQQVREKLLGAYANQDVPFEQLIEELEPERSLSRNPIFQVMVVMQNAPLGELTMRGLAVEEFKSESEVTKFDLGIVFRETEAGLAVTVDYATDLFERGSIERLLENYRVVLEEVIRSPEQAVKGLAVMSERERQEVLVEWNRTEHEYEVAGSCVHELFEQEVKREPGAVALVWQESELSYEQLNRRANQIASYLRQRGIGPEARVGLYLERGVQLVACMLGVLKAGGAYVPLETRYPQERVSWMVRDSGARLVLTQESVARGLGELAAPVISVEQEWKEIARQPAANVASRATGDNLAYIIYTSGSTGTPKGVAVSHSALWNLTNWHLNYYGLGHQDRMTQLASFGFDASVWEIWPTLASGASLWIVPEETRGSASDLLQWLIENDITISFVPTPIAELMMKLNWPADTKLRALLTGGDKLTYQDRTSLYSNLINHYGPTEGTVVATCAHIKPDEDTTKPITIGRPIGNVEAYVLDGEMEPVPVGVIGELYLGGKSLARGYEGRGDLTAAAFVPHGFSEERGARLYRTGDLVRYRDGGELEFVGRRDEQVKIRGYRIELGEIEAVLQQHEEVVAAVVVSRVEERRGEQELVAYVVGERERGIEKRELREYLRQRLPEYMVPARLEVLGELPLTSNGKVDRQALPAPEAEELGEQYEAPRSLEQELMAGIWADVLGVERVGIGEDFFALGGHSLLATQVMTRLSEALGVRVPLRSLFEHPTIAGLSAELKRAGAGVAPPRMERVSRAGELPLSYAQQRLWFLEQLAPESAAYNVPLGVRLRGALDKEALRRSLNEIVKRHEVLRTSFPEVGGKPVQRIAAWEEIVVEEQDLSEEEDAEYKARQELAAEARRPFALAQGPLLRARLLQVGEEDHVLLVTMHHIISDGWSMGVLVRELAAFYEAYTTGAEAELSELPIQYADYAVWQRQWLEQGVKEEQLRYWRAELAGVETLNLPTDRVRPAIESFRGGQVEVVWEEELVERLRKLSREQGVTLFMVLLAGLEVLLARYSGQPEVVVGTAIANRHQRQIEDLIGFFVNTVVLRGEVRGGMSMVELIQQVREKLLGAYANQDVPFEQLIEELEPERSLSRNPIFQVMVVMQNAPLGELTMRGLAVAEFKSESEVTKFDLGIVFRETEAGLAVTVDYATDLFERGSIERLVENYRVVLEEVIRRPEQPVKGLAVMSERERQEVLVEWNRTGQEYEAAGSCVHELFEQEVKREPGAVALVWQESELSYEQLNRRANQLASYLRKRGIGPEARVGLYLERGVQLVACMLGVLKAGGAYVPLETRYPPERVSWMVRDSGARLVLTQESVGRGLGELAAPVISVEQEWKEIARQPAANVASRATGDNLAYIIYTSGSTGTPKGVAVSHSALRNLALTQIESFGISPGSAVLQFASPVFDASVSEWTTTLLAGAVLVLAPRDELASGARLLSLLDSAAINTVTLFPSVLSSLTKVDLPNLKTLVLAGEPCTADLVAKWSEGRRLLNAYGPTEMTVCTTISDPLTGTETPDIGKPIKNTQVYVLDENLEPVPIGVVGELYISGRGMARGYLNNPSLTAERFIPNPFAQNPGSRMYRSGDMVKWRPEGKLEYVERRDSQVKIRGHRIELGEIEAAISQHPMVQQSAVKVIGTDSDKQLVAYISVKSEEDDSDHSRHQHEHVSQWQGVFDQSYEHETTEDDITFNVTGWNSSYTGLPFSKEEMFEWTSNTVDQILELKPQRVLEIGCGTGLLVFRIAPNCAEYFALDMSDVALGNIRKGLEQTGLSNVRLIHAAADDFDWHRGETFDCVILNSVVQYLPDVSYFLKVLRRVSQFMRPNGVIFVGDVRNQALSPAFYTSLELEHADSLPDWQSLHRRVEARMRSEEELLIHPQLFSALKQNFPAITAVEVRPKRGRYHNELTGYRYDVLLHFGSRVETVDTTKWHSWRGEDWSLSSLSDWLLREKPEKLGLTRVPNARVLEHVKAWGKVTESYDPEQADTARSVNVEKEQGVDIDELCTVTAKAGYRIDLSWLNADATGCFDVLLTRSNAITAGLVPGFEMDHALHTDWQKYTNSPLERKLSQTIIPEIRQHLLQKLPEYMLPATYLLLSKLPSTVSGKVDRNALPDPERGTFSSSYVEPRTPIEEILAGIWANILALPRVGVDDDFFDLGGHSLLAMQVASRLRDNFKVDVPLRSLFKYPTIAGLARQLEQALAAGRGRELPPIERVSRDHHLPLSFAQQRLWFLAQMEPDNPFYNMPIALRLTGSLDTAALQQSLNELVLRHEVLRTSFPMVDGETRQMIRPFVQMPVMQTDLSQLSEPDRSREVALMRQQEARQCFDLANGPLLRAKLLRLKDDDHLLLLTMHHIISDGWSIAVMTREMVHLYEASRRNVAHALPELPIQYADYAYWQRTQLKGEVFSEHLEYWKRQLSGVQTFQFPTDQPRPTVPSYRGVRTRFVLPADLSAEVKAFSTHEGVTLFMTLLAAFKVLLYRHSNQSEITVGTDVANRNQTELERLIGFFVNLLVLRTEVSGNASFRELLAQVREVTLGAYAHQDFPFDQVVKSLRYDRDPGRNPLFDVLFVLQNAPRTRLQVPGLTIDILDAEDQTTRFDLALFMTEEDQQLHQVWVSNPDLYHTRTIQRLAVEYQDLLARVVKDPEVIIEHLAFERSTVLSIKKHAT